MNIIVRTTITTTTGDLLHESTQLVRTDVTLPPVVGFPTPMAVPMATSLAGQPVKRKPGRPRKNPLPEAAPTAITPVKRKPGRPRKNPTATD